MHRIVIVDDDPASLDLVAGQLEQLPNCTVSTFSEGLKALMECTASPPDLAIIDIHMPGLSGIDVAKSLKRNSEIPFIFLSSDNKDEVVSQAAESGAIGYILKPVDADRLIPTVQIALRLADELKSLRTTQASAPPNLVFSLQKSISNLTRAVDREQDVAMATGVVMALMGLNSDSAAELLRNTARTSRCKLLDLSRRVLDGEAIAGLSPGFDYPDNAEKNPNEST